MEIEPIQGAPLEDISALLETCRRSEFTGARDSALLLCLLDMGARVTEFLSIDLTDRDSTGAITLRHTKGKRARVVYLSQKTRKALRTYLRMRHDNSPALWISKNNDRLSYDGLRAILTKRAKLAGLKEVPASINLKMSAIRKLATEAADNGLLDQQIANGGSRVSDVTSHGIRSGN